MCHKKIILAPQGFKKISFAVQGLQKNNTCTTAYHLEIPFIIVSTAVLNNTEETLWLDKGILNKVQYNKETLRRLTSVGAILLLFPGCIW